MENCNKEIYEKGTTVFITHTISSENMEQWVQRIAKESGQKVDWHFFAGRAVVKTLGDFSKVKKAIINNKELHNTYYYEALDKLNMYYNKISSEDILSGKECKGIWEYNGF